MTTPIPISRPSAAELWRRNQLAQSVLGHRPIEPLETRNLLLAILRGEVVAVPNPKEAS